MSNANFADVFPSGSVVVVTKPNTQGVSVGARLRVLGNWHSADERGRPVAASSVQALDDDDTTIGSATTVDNLHTFASATKAVRQ